MTGIPFRTALAWSAASGAVALAWEMCWIRLNSYASAGNAEAFGLMLGFYLVGLAAGAWGSTRWFGDASTAQSLAGIGRVVAFANVIAFLVAPLSAWLYVSVPAGFFTVRVLTLIPVALVGMLFGIVFPLLCHMAVVAGRFSGRDVSYLYVANIVGASAGSLLTTFVLMDHLSVAALSVTVLVAGHLWAESLAAWRLPVVFRALTVIVAVLAPTLFDGIYERLFYKRSWTPARTFALVLESRHGVIAVDADGTLIGNGVYDSVIHSGINPTTAHVRPFWLGAVHPEPKDVLVIGLASGTWARVMANHPAVESLTAVEISAGYLDLVAARPEVSDLLRDPRVTVEIDDGRRWLRNQSGRQFDVIVWNTFHWREMSTSLLSIEFLQLVRARLKPGGVAIWNSTGSGRVVATGLAGFPHLIRFGSFLIGSATPIALDWERWAALLPTYRIAGRLAFDPATPEGPLRLREALTLRDRQGPQADGNPYSWSDGTQLKAAHGHEAIITDDNLGREYRRWQERLHR